MHCDYFVIGLGLGGAAVSHELMKTGRKVLVIDNNSSKSSSMAAAGMFNPITGRRWVKSWMYDALYPVGRDYYSDLENQLGTRFFFPKPIFRPFTSPEEQNDWVSKAGMVGFRNYLSSVLTNPYRKDILRNPFGGAMIDRGGFLNVQLFLRLFRNNLSDQRLLRNDSFNLSACSQRHGRYYWKGDSARKIIFCEGVNKSNIWDFLPFRPVKGEILTIHCDIDLEDIVTKGVFCIPRGNGLFRVGSTYDFKDLTNEPTSSGRQAIRDRLKEFLLKDFTIRQHWAGVRPAILDRRPVIGPHPENEDLIIFNGLGSKGVTLAPYLSRNLIDHLEKGTDLMKEVDLKRFYS